MTSTRLRATLAVLAVLTASATLSACASPTFPTASGPIKATKIPGPILTAKPKPVVLTEPASRYSFGCDDLMPAAAVHTLYTIPMPEIDEAAWERLNLDSSIPDSDYIGDLGGISCIWYDRAKTNSNSHDIQLSVLPVTPAEWTHYFGDIDSSEKVGNTVVECDDDGGDYGGHSCEYDADINGSRLALKINNMAPGVTSNTRVLPPLVKTIVASMIAKLNASPAGTAPNPQHPPVALPAAGTSMLTAAQVRTALGVPASVHLAVQCNTVLDGPWEVSDEARNEIMGGIICAYGTPEVGDSGDPYGLFEFLPAGAWAAAKLATDTPSEVPVTVAGLPAGDTFSEYTDDQGNPVGDLVIGGNLLEFYLLIPAPSDLPKNTVPAATSMVNLAKAFETTIRG